MHFPVIVLGNNIYGFVSAIFIKNAVVIGNQPSFFPFKNRGKLLKDCEPNRLLMQELLINIPSRTVHYGYFIGNDFFFPSKKLAKELYNLFRVDKEPSDIWMQDHSEKFFVIDITEDEVSFLCYNILLSEGRIIHDKIREINIIKKKIQGTYQTYEYDTLVVSLPAIDFLRLAKIDIEQYKFIYAMKYYALFPVTELPSKIERKMKELDYVYTINTGLPFFRISNSGALVIGETYSPIDEYRYMWYEKYGIIIDSKWNPKEFEMLDIFFIGREAKFCEEYYLNDAVADSIELREKLQK